jgi:hypothetical protein
MRDLSQCHRRKFPNIFYFVFASTTRLTTRGGSDRCNLEQSVDVILNSVSFKKLGLTKKGRR